MLPTGLVTALAFEFLLEIRRTSTYLYVRKYKDHFFINMYTKDVFIFPDVFDCIYEQSKDRICSLSRAVLVPRQYYDVVGREVRDDYAPRTRYVLLYHRHTIP